MKARTAIQYAVTRPNSLILAGAFIIVAAVVAVPFYSASSSSLPTGTLGASVPAEATRKVGQVSSLTANSTILARWSSTFWPLLPTPPPSPEGIAAYASDCVTPKTDFILGDRVCAKATGVPVTLFPWRVSWVDTVGFIRQSDTAIADDQATYTYTLPSSSTSVVNGQTVNNAGTWRVNLTRFNGAIQQTARFTVHDPANAAADVFVQKFVRSGDASVASAGSIAFILVVGNQGPDTALVVHLVDSVPNGSTLASFTQQSGPDCTPVGNSDCTIAGLTNGERAEFTAIYNTGSSAPGTYFTSASVSSSIPDPDNSNNTSTAQFTIVAGSGGANCEITCPTDITAAANTTENGQRGAHVSYPDPVSTGDCGSVSSTPASGSFFPVGTTTVNATSETGGGSCSFTVTVVDNGGPTITCPPNKTVSADANCQATVDPGQPTTTGDNVTVTSSRSDEKSLNDPYPSGTTTITWTATNSSGSASCQQTITVNDMTPPTISCPAPTSASADANCQAAVPNFTTSATVSDNCSAPDSITVTQDPAPGTMVGLGQNTVTLTATDGAGNSSTCTTTFTVNDTMPPTVSCPAPTSASADANCQAPIPDVASGAAASDNCGPVTVTQSPAAGTQVGLGSHTITVTATDGAGNSSTCTTTFTVNDTTPPTITCPANITTNNVPGTCSALVNPGVATATDNCGTTTVSGTRSDGQPLIAPYPVGTTSITWTATDNSGNSSSCTQTIVVNDTEAPTITGASATPSVLPPPPNHRMVDVTVNYGVSDNCTPPSAIVCVLTVSSNEPVLGTGSGDTAPDWIVLDAHQVQLRDERDGAGSGRVYTITITCTDSAGNSSSQNVTVTVPH
jgi:hypothetical protein